MTIHQFSVKLTDVSKSESESRLVITLKMTSFDVLSFLLPIWGLEAGSDIPIAAEMSLLHDDACDPWFVPGITSRIVP